MPVFGDRENPFKAVPNGDYILCVVGFECAISSGGKTAGANKYEVEFEVEGPPAVNGARVFENLIEHESCDWKIDAFLKSAGVALAKGEAFEFRADLAEASGVRWVNPLGLRVWATVRNEDYKGRMYPKVAAFITNKPKLEPREIKEEDTPF